MLCGYLHRNKNGGGDAPSIAIISTNHLRDLMWHGWHDLQYKKAMGNESERREHKDKKTGEELQRLNKFLEQAKPKKGLSERVFK